MRHYNLMHKPVPMPQTMKTPDAGRSKKKIVGEAEEFTSMARTKSTASKR